MLTAFTFCNQVVCLIAPIVFGVTMSKAKVIATFLAMGLFLFLVNIDYSGEQFRAIMALKKRDGKNKFQVLHHY